MRLDPPTADLHQFARSGRLGPLAIGVSRQSLVRTLGPPTDWGVGGSADVAGIWKYGDMELHFADDEVWLIHCDNFDVPTGGPSFAIRPWIIRHGLALHALEDALRQSGVEFTSGRDPSNPDCVMLVTSAGVRFLVCVDGPSDDLGLVLFSCSRD